MQDRFAPSDVKEIFPMADYRQGDRSRANDPRRDSSIFSTSDRSDQWREDYQKWSSGPSGRQEPQRGDTRSDTREPRQSLSQERAAGSTSRDYRSNQGRPSSDDRGFFDRAGDELRSWFGDEEAERRREADAQRYEREHGTAGSYRGGGHEDQWTGGPSDRGDQYSRSPMSSNRGQQAGGYSQDRYAGGYGGGQSAQTYGAGQQGDHYSRGQTGAQGGAGQSYGQSGSGQSSFGQSGSGQPSYGQSSHGQSGQAWGQAGQAGESRGGQSGAAHHDENYRRWRDQQISALDRDYEEYCRQRQQQFEQDFSSFRQTRQTGITSGGPTMGQSGAPRGSTEIASSSGAAQGMGATTSGQSGGSGGRNAASTTTGAGSASATKSSVGSTGMAAETGNELTGTGSGTGKSGKSRS
jgi:hypothetical protein